MAHWDLNIAYILPFSLYKEGPIVVRLVINLGKIGEFTSYIYILLKLVSHFSKALITSLVVSTWSLWPSIRKGVNIIVGFSLSNTSTIFSISLSFVESSPPSGSSKKYIFSKP